MPAFKKGNLLWCVYKPADKQWLDITVGSSYRAAADSYVSEGIEYVELCGNDSDEPYTHHYAMCFRLEPRKDSYHYHNLASALIQEGINQLDAHFRDLIGQYRTDPKMLRFLADQIQVVSIESVQNTALRNIDAKLHPRD